MSGDIKRRLGRLEDANRPDSEDERQREEERDRIRQEAERMNTHAAESLGVGLPPFTITEDGEVRSSRDGKPITTFHQTLAEVLY